MIGKPLKSDHNFISKILMKEKIIAIDIDDVLANTVSSLLRKYNYTLNGNPIRFEDITEYNFWNIKKFNLTQRKALTLLIKHFIWSWIFKKIEPIPWAKEKILELKNKWYKLFIITARHPLLKLTTKLRLRRYFRWCFDGTIFAWFLNKNAKKKSDICKNIWASVMIEDNLENAIECANIWLNVFLFDRPRNWAFDPKKHKGIIKVKSRDDINI